LHDHLLRANKMLFDIETVLAEFTAPKFPTLPILRRVQIYGERYYYKLVRGSAEGKDSVRFFNSVTSVTHKTVGDKGQLIKWAAGKGDSYQQEMQESAAYGTLVHHFLPRLVEFKQDLIDLPAAYREAAYTLRSGLDQDYLLRNQASLLPKLTKDLYAIHCLLKDLHFKPLAVELCLSSDVLGVAGALDLVGWINGNTLAILDLKTGCRDGNFYADYEAQLAIYAMLWNDNPELVAAYGKVEAIANFSPKDYPVGARTFYNVKVWEWEKAQAEARSYLDIFERNHAADSGGLAIAEKKLQIITGSVGLNGGQPERVVKTYQQFVTEQHKADFDSLPFADPEPEPTAEEAAANVAAADEFLQAAESLAKQQSDHTADAMACFKLPEGVDGASVFAPIGAFCIPVPELTSKGRPPAEYSAAKAFNEMVAGAVSVPLLRALVKSAPKRTKVEQMVYLHLEQALAKSLTILPDVLYIEPEPTTPAAAPEPAATVESVEETAEGVNVKGNVWQKPPEAEVATDTAEQQALTDPRQPDLFNAKPVVVEPVVPEAVLTEVKAGMGEELARTRLGQVNAKLHALVRQGALMELTADEYEAEKARLQAIRKTYLAVLEEYEEKRKASEPPF